MNNQIGDNNSNIEVSEKIENLHSKKVHTEYITIEAKPYSEARGTLEHIHDDHLEISEEKTSVNNNKMLIYKEKGAGIISRCCILGSADCRNAGSGKTRKNKRSSKRYFQGLALC